MGMPLLDAMTPAARTGAAEVPLRMLFCYVPNGIIMEDWTPKATGAGFAFPRIMKPLEPLREKITVLTGLTHNTGRALGDGPGDHARAASTFLTGVHPKKTFGADISLGMSADQVAAQAFASKTRFASIELGLELGRLAGNCDSGYSCAYSNSISWRSPTTPNPPEVNPRQVFERLFGNFDPSETAESRAKRERYNKSILDFVLEDTQSLKKDLGPTDKRKLDEYMTSIREVEARIANSEKLAKNDQALSLLTPGYEKPMGIPVDYAEHAKIMFDLMTIAMQADVTRVMTLMMAREGSNRSYREIGVGDGHHGLTHHRMNQEWIEKIKKINEYHVLQFSFFLKKLDSIKEGDGTMLDHSMIAYGSGLADGNRHTHHDLPMLIAGKASGKLRTGRHVQYPSFTPLTNLYLAMLDHMDVAAGALGDSTGPLGQLTYL